MARLDEYYRDAHPPPVQGVLPVAYAVVRDGPGGRVLLVRRADDGNWELPGGRVDVGESAAAAAVREVAEEAGIAIVLTGLVGVFSDPSHIVVYLEEGARQQLAVCFHAVPDTRDDQADTTARPDHDETVAAIWFDPADTATLAMHPAVRERLTHAFDHPDRPHFD